MIIWLIYSCTEGISAWTKACLVGIVWLQGLLLFVFLSVWIYNCFKHKDASCLLLHIWFWRKTPKKIDVSSNSISKNTKRWPIVIFYGNSEYSYSTNAFIITWHNNSDVDFSRDRRSFAKALGIEFLKYHPSSRATTSGLNRYIRNDISKYSGWPNQQQGDQPANERGHCNYWNKRKRRY